MTAICWPDFLTFTYPSTIWNPQWVGYPRAIGFISGMEILEWLGYNPVKVAWWSIQSFEHNTSTQQTHRQPRRHSNIQFNILHSCGKNNDDQPLLPMLFRDKRTMGICSTYSVAFLPTSLTRPRRRTCCSMNRCGILFTWRNVVNWSQKTQELYWQKRYTKQQSNAITVTYLSLKCTGWLPVVTNLIHGENVRFLKTFINKSKSAKIMDFTELHGNGHFHGRRLVSGKANSRGKMRDFTRF